MKNRKRKQPVEHVAEESATRPRGRPVQYELPERIDAAPEEIAEVVLGAKPKSTWRYEEKSGRKRNRKTD